MHHESTNAEQFDLVRFKADEFKSCFSLGVVILKKYLQSSTQSIFDNEIERANFKRSTLRDFVNEADIVISLQHDKSIIVGTSPNQEVFSIKQRCAGV